MPQRHADLDDHGVRCGFQQPGRRDALPDVAVSVAQDDDDLPSVARLDEGLAGRAARHEPDDLRRWKRVAEAMVRFAGRDRRLGQELDDERRPRERHVAVDKQRPPGRLEADVSGSHVEGLSLDTARQGMDAGRGFPQPFLGEPARPHGFDDGGVHRLRAELGAEAQRVSAGLECANGALLHTDRRADRAHLERVGDDEAGEAELVTQEPTDRGPAQRCGCIVQSLRSGCGRS